ncbi:E3 ubiquitin/ISG15 ligase TRIM25-like isoform X1 [Acipenser ruthenus]|uniref:E3 ubiquitin/ISG15 ligase TRIM25-like isoform X1 n=1 Tax=Acipenser ruthenus TaxID=7906 RepID=UPI00145BC4EF|nr:E3 ubiquitin/ISG15 ligase TRIM25-like isoform X1 [Acipenser ruthenus]XP_033894654.1 E3 ubiquitin/ISG15 ligase TRIM25-like isoform X1 [Acipenser ruthenus]XP_058845821.1 E3 ubiquitin/ISG15 ligase TRIM25-like isoform X1 [Acipenser ruthenus]XP_058845822.1 E3 ubiquitin/ISG15 ligase TRIM25-like isoform X1 [Acipenser ruthenus]
MAAAVSPIAMIVPEDELKCPICLDLIDNPVTIPCGHNFCMKCIVKYWPRTLSSSYSCPHCRKSFSRLPSLHPNTMLRSMIKHAVKSKGLKPNSAVARDGDVHCDVCTGTKLRAVKTCVNCLASFCDVHLRPHLESSVLRLHGLRDPVSDMQEILCKHHKRLLEYFCKKHWECLCSLCLVKHRKCPTQTVEERRGVKEADYKRKLIAIKTQKDNIQEAINIVEDTEVEISVTASQFKADVTKHFVDLGEIIAGTQKKAIALIEAEELEALGQTESVLELLNLKTQKLEECEDEINEQINETDLFDFLKHKLVLPPLYETEQLPSPEIKLNGWVVEKITSALIALKSILNTQLESVLDLQETDPDSGDFDLVSGRRKPRSKLMQYACGLSFDSSTSSASVLLSEDSCAVSVEEADLQAWKDYVVNVDMGFRILCTQGFQSRQHYWEVHPPVDRNSNWAIGVSYRTASDRYRTLGEDKTSWCIKSRVHMKEAAGSELPSQGLFAYHDGVAHEVPQQYPRNVGVYLDCDRGFVSFFSVSDTKATFWYKYKVLFTDPVHPAVWLREPKSKMKISEQSSSKSQVSEVMD